jgi:hypothetical protein
MQLGYIKPNPEFYDRKDIFILSSNSSSELAGAFALARKYKQLKGKFGSSYLEPFLLSLENNYYFCSFVVYNSLNSEILQIDWSNQLGEFTYNKTLGQLRYSVSNQVIKQSVQWLMSIYNNHRTQLTKSVNSISKIPTCPICYGFLKSRKDNVRGFEYYCPKKHSLGFGGQYFLKRKFLYKERENCVIFPI